MAKKTDKPKTQTTTKGETAIEKELKKEIKKAKDSIDKIKNASITAPMEEDQDILDREEIKTKY